MAEPKNIYLFIFEFFSVHILFFGGVTAYNSYYDKDEGPIGGLKNPPKMKHWMLYASWIFQIVGLMFATLVGVKFVVVYLISMLFFWMYSSPLVRLKGKPILSIVAMSIATGVGAFLMGYFSFGGEELNLNVLLLALGSTFSFIAVYPVSQAYQIDEDKKRGDITFAVKYGIKGIKSLFLLLFPLGIILSSFVLIQFNKYVFMIYISGALIIGVYIWFTICNLKLDKSSYDKIMMLKYFSGTTLAIFSSIILVLKVLGGI